MESIVFAFAVDFAFVDTLLTAGFSGAAAPSVATLLGRPRFLMAGGSTVMVADVAAAIES
jgi:hypothetical protein